MTAHRSIDAKLNRERVARRRSALREQGLRLRQLWVPDTTIAGFWEQIEQDCRRLAESTNRADDLAFAEALQFWPEDDPD